MNRFKCLCLGTFGMMASSSAHALTITATFDSYWQTYAPSAATAAVNAVDAMFSSMFSNPGNVNLTFGWNEVNGQTLGGGTLGETSSSLIMNQSYNNVASLLAGYSSGHPQNAVLASEVANLPGSGSNPYLNSSFAIPHSQYTALTGTSYSGTDAYVGFGSGFTWDYSQAGGITAGYYDFTGVAIHEITHALGRVNYEFINPTPFLTPLDLTRYTCGATTLNSASGSTACFSINGGVTDLATYSATSDSADLNGATTDPFNAYMSPGTTYTMTAVGSQIMQSLGWTVPEPGTFYLFAPALAGMLYRGRIRGKGLLS